MTAVFSASAATTTTGISYSPPTSLRRSPSQQHLHLDTTPTKRPTISFEERKYSNSLSSSAPSSPRLASHDLSSLPSFASTPASSVCLQDPFFADRDDDLQFPSYNISPEDDDETLTPCGCSPASPNNSEVEACADHKLYHSIGDDLDIKDQPSRHVDYLSHNWKEEDVWSSWRHIVGQRNHLENWERLENAAWRTWQKSRNNLPVVPPEKLNWMKEHDVTWLYGPLQTGDMKRFSETAPVSATALSRVDSFVVKKSCLKKRSLSEAMLRRSISTSTLVQQAVDSLVSQVPVRRNGRTLGPRMLSDYTRPSRYTSMVPNDTPAGLTSSSGSSGIQSPTQQRHIHFSEKVEQCIAINSDTEEADSHIHEPSEDESEEEVLMMVSEKGKERRLSSRPTTPRPSFSGEEKPRSIAMLAPTTLRGDTFEPIIDVRPSLTKSSSQETLKPKKAPAKYLWDDADDAELSWQPSPAADAEFEDEDEEMQLKGLRRTPSGMFMPYDQDGEDHTSAGVLGRVIDTINTAKDIAHVVWNVGWRK